MVSGASSRGHGDEHALRRVLADLMLRFSLFQHGVDRVIVAMRKVDWVVRNLESVSRGPLTAEERRWLQSLRDPVSAREPRWWQRLRRRR